VTGWKLILLLSGSGMPNRAGAKRRFDQSTGRKLETKIDIIAEDLATLVG